MKPVHALAALGLIAATLAAPAFAQVGIALTIGVPPPAPMVEVVPAPRVGYAWAPGYWAWHRDRYIWIGGRWVVARPGYAWVPDRWVQVGPRWERHPGYWEREHRGRGHAYGRRER